MVNGILQPGQGLQGATVQVKDRSAVVSRTDGRFSFPLRASTYYVQSVKKNGYQLVDMEACRSYQYSKDPLYLVMETPEQQLEDLLEAQENISKTLREQLKRAQQEIQRLKDEQEITEEQYFQQLEQLREEQQKSQKLISDMAKECSRIDYDLLDELNRRISDAIFNGRLLEADSLLRSKGDIDSRIAAVEKKTRAEAEREKEIDKDLEDLAISKAGTKKEKEEIANDCYRFFDRFKLSQQLDSAAYYLERRTKLDPENIAWGLSFATFLIDYMADYSLAMSVCMELQERAATTIENDSTALLPILTTIGTIQYYNGAVNKAHDVFLQALGIAKQHCQEDNFFFAECYYDLGNVCFNQDDLQGAWDYYEKALAYYEAYPGHQEELGMLQNSIGALKSSEGNYSLALEWYEKALATFEECYKTDNPAIAMVNNNIGFNLEKLGRNNEALSRYEKALSIWIKNYGENHPSVAACYNNIGNIYEGSEDSHLAMSYFTKALKIDLSCLGENNPSTALCYNNIAYNYAVKGEYDKAIENYKKVLSIRISVYGDSNPSVANTLTNMGITYSRNKMYSEGKDCLEKALDIWEKILGPENQNSEKLKELIHEIEKKIVEQK
jgi:tetratricopeptide (TPR) repeat protein